MKVAAIDFETANGASQSACSIGCCIMEQGEITWQNEILIRPHPRYGRFDAFNITIHHITPDMVADQPEWPAVYPQVKTCFEDAVVVAHNAAFDMRVLKSLDELYGIGMADFMYLDTVQIARFLYPFLANAKLDTVCSYLNMDLQHHQAGSDALGCLQIINDLMGKYQTYDIQSLIALVGLVPHHYDRLDTHEGHHRWHR